MAKARALDRRRKSIRNIRKITRTMELIATAKFRKAMDRAMSATAYTRRITALVGKLAQGGQQVSHPLLEKHPQTNSAILLVITANRGLCGGYNSGVMRVGTAQLRELQASVPEVQLEVAGKRGISAFRFRKFAMGERFTQFDDKPTFAEVEVLADRYMKLYQAGKLDRLDIAYTRFESLSRQYATVETLLPLGSLETNVPAGKNDPSAKNGPANGPTNGPTNGSAKIVPQYEFVPSMASIVDEVVPASFKVRLFKCFLDAAVSEQIARRVAMKSATENAGEMIGNLSIAYNRARQSQITGELLEILGGAEALNK